MTTLCSEMGSRSLALLAVWLLVAAVPAEAVGTLKPSGRVGQDPRTRKGSGSGALKVTRKPATPGPRCMCFCETDGTGDILLRMSFEERTALRQCACTSCGPATPGTASGASGARRCLVRTLVGLCEDCQPPGFLQGLCGVATSSDDDGSEEPGTSAAGGMAARPAAGRGN